jgi:hypothetical protein
MIHVNGIVQIERWTSSCEILSFVGFKPLALKHILTSGSSSIIYNEEL